MSWRLSYNGRSGAPALLEPGPEPEPGPVCRIRNRPPEPAIGQRPPDSEPDSATPFGGFGTDSPPHRPPRASRAPVAATATATTSGG